jgi:hypothetical protein
VVATELRTGTAEALARRTARPVVGREDRPTLPGPGRPEDANRVLSGPTEITRSGVRVTALDPRVQDAQAPVGFWPGAHPTPALHSRGQMDMPGRPRFTFRAVGTILAASFRLDEKPRHLGCGDLPMGVCPTSSPQTWRRRRSG